MGSSRSMFVHVIVELRLILSLAALALFWNTTDTASIVVQMQTLGFWGFLTHPQILLIALGLIILILAESGRLPFDNPATHLELTMSEHAIGIEYGGRHWAALKLAEMLKNCLFVDLTCRSLHPWLCDIPTLSPLDGSNSFYSLCNQAQFCNNLTSRLGIAARTTSD